MEILYLLIPMSAVLVLLILGVFAWAVHKGQFDDVDREGERILEDDTDRIAPNQQHHAGIPEESTARLP